MRKQQWPNARFRQHTINTSFSERKAPLQRIGYITMIDTHS